MTSPDGKLPDTLRPESPLHRFLAEDVAGGVLGIPGHRPLFDVRALDHRTAVRLYADRRSPLRLVGKSYARKLAGSGQESLGADLMRREYEALLALRRLGFDKSPCEVVRPLAVSADLGCLLVLDFVPGASLLDHIRHVSDGGSWGRLSVRLERIAHFLAGLHTATRSDERVAPAEAVGRLQKYTDLLALNGIIDQANRRVLVELGQAWLRTGVLDGARQALTQGDPTPPHFIFDAEGALTVLDLERLWPGDPAADLGCLVAELKHLFLQQTGDPWASEPFIRHLYGAYLDRADQEAPELTTRGRFYQGCYELRIARNAWLEVGHRRALAADARACLAPP